jgi:geranylgeranyl diphosphate synthase type II
MEQATARRLRVEPPVALVERVDGVLDLVRIRLTELVRERQAAAEPFGPPCAQLWADLGDGIGGKLLRPRLAVAVYLSLGGRDPRPIVPVAAAMEVLHAAMLVHDDLLDGDEIRRGRPNLAGRTRRRLDPRGLPTEVVDRQVAATAVLAGDAGLAAAFRLLATTPAPAATSVALVDLLGRTIETTVAGELLDVVGELADLGHVDPLAVAELKTAAYSTRLPLMAGGMVAGAAPARIDALDRIGSRLGVAYQLVDDELGVFGDPAQTGKSVLSDLRDGKRTMLLQLAWQRADAEGRRVLQRHVGDRALDELGAARVRAVLRGTGARDQVRALGARITDEALDIAAEELPRPLLGLLTELVEELSVRGR